MGAQVQYSSGSTDLHGFAEVAPTSLALAPSLCERLSRAAEAVPRTTPMTTHEIVLFVYDNLMKGEDQHEWLASARSLGVATTTPQYALVDLGTSGALVQGG